MNLILVSNKKRNQTLKCAGHVVDFKLSLLAASPPYDIDSASNKYSYVHIAVLVESLCSPFGWILDNAHTLTSTFNFHSPALMLHLWSKYLCTVWHKTKIKIIIIKTANNLPRLNHLVPKERKKEKKNQC